MMETRSGATCPDSLAVATAPSAANRNRGVALVCPICNGELCEQRDKLQCAACQKNWPVVDGVPTFIEDVPYRGEIPPEALAEVNARIRERHWKEVLFESDDSAVREAAEEITSLGSSNWHWLTGLAPRSRVLDVGAGLGAQSHALACRFDEVVALEAMREKIDFLRQRFSQEGIHNVKIVRTSVWDIPFADRSFDLVAFNGVLELLAFGRKGDPGDLQLSALKKAFNLLIPGGYLYAGVENRIHLGAFMGKKDSACSSPYLAALPRPLANWYARRRRLAEGHCSYSYTMRGYRRLLARAGFSDIRFYLAVPIYRTPRLYLPVKENVFSYYHKNFDPLRSGPISALGNRLLSGLRLLKYMQRSFVILARRNSR